MVRTGGQVRISAARRLRTPFTKRPESSVENVLGQLDGLVDDHGRSARRGGAQLVDADAQHGRSRPGMRSSSSRARAARCAVELVDGR